MALRSPSGFHNFWGQYANVSSLPGVPSAEINLQTGDIAYTTDTDTLYVCTDATTGSVVWSETAITALTGDVTATGPGSTAATVVALQGSDVSAATPADGEALVWSAGASAWTPTALPADTGITELTGDVEAGPGDGSQAATVTGLRNNPVSAIAPNAGDVLVWDGTEWVPTSMINFTAANFDAFGLLRTSSPQTVFEGKTVYDSQPLYFAEQQTPAIGGPPAGSWSAADAKVTLSVAANQSSVRQSRRYLNYQPGKSQLVLLTFNMNGITANATKRAGYFDATNGIFLELSNSGVAFVRRSGSSITPSTLTELQSAWNLDPMDGTGPSGINLAWDKTQILVIDFQWLGVGSVRCGFVVDGQLVYAHRFDNANINSYVYMSTPNLPVRWEVVGAAGLVGSATLDCICASVNSEGGVQSAGTQYSYVRPTLTGNIAGGATATLLSIRHTTAYPRVTIVPINVSPCSDSNGVSLWELVYNPSLAGATWGATNGYLDIDTAGTATGGTVLEAGTFTNSVGAQNLNLRDTTLTLGNPVVVNNLGTPSTDFDVISLRIKNLSSGNQTYIASLAWIAVT